MKHVPAVLVGAWLLSASASLAFAQSVPTTQPGLINIVREDVKLGHAEDHSKFEAGWPAAYARSKSPYSYLALVAITGPAETWYVTAYASFGGMGEAFKHDDADAVLTAELGRLTRGDAAHLNSVRVMQATARPDLGYGPFPDLGLVRFFEVTTFRVRPGFEAGFEAAAKAYAAAARKAGPGANWRAYEISAGMVGPTFLVFNTVKTLGEFDVAMKENGAMIAAMTPDEVSAWQKWSREGLISTETQRFRVDPGQSYVDQATKDKDPAFWMPKKSATRP